MRQEITKIDWPHTRLTLLDRVRTLANDAIDEFFAEYDQIINKKIVEICEHEAFSISCTIFHDYTKGDNRSEDKRRVLVDVSSRRRKDLEDFIKKLEPYEIKGLFYEQIRHIEKKGKYVGLTHIEKAYREKQVAVASGKSETFRDYVFNWIKWAITECAKEELISWGKFDSIDEKREECAARDSDEDAYEKVLCDAKERQISAMKTENRFVDRSDSTIQAKNEKELWDGLPGDRKQILFELKRCFTKALFRYPKFYKIYKKYPIFARDLLFCGQRIGKLRTDNYITNKELAEKHGLSTANVQLMREKFLREIEPVVVSEMHRELKRQFLFVNEEEMQAFGYFFFALLKGDKSWTQERIIKTHSITR